MDVEAWQRVKRIVHSALEQDPEVWPTFVAESCNGDTDLMHEVTSLLEVSSRVADFIEVPVLELLRRRASARMGTAIKARTGSVVEARVGSV